MDKQQTVLGQLDPDVLERVASRRDALRSLGRMGAGAALATVPLALAVSARSAFGQGLSQQVIAVLNFALTLEYLEAEFYTRGVAQAGLIPASDQPIFVKVRDHEQAHVALLTSVLGSNAVAKPQFDFTAGGMFNPFGNYDQFKLLSQAFEDTGVRAYKGQAPRLIDNDQVLTTALRIHSVEARHASVIRRLRGLQGWIPFTQPDGIIPAVQPVYQGEAETMQLGVNVLQVASSGVSEEDVTEAFDEPLTMEQVLAIVDPFIVG